MTTFIQSSEKWAEAVFAGSDMYDARLKNRLISYAELQSNDPGASTSKVCFDNKAAREGAYRLLENSRATATEFEEGPFQHTANLCKNRKVLLAIQDTTSCQVAHNDLRDQVERGPGHPVGFLVHSTLMVDGESEEILGLIDQQRWFREKGAANKKDQSPQFERESQKWLTALDAYTERLGNNRSVITVADREADIFNVIDKHQEIGARFIFRSRWNREKSSGLARIHESVKSSPIVASRRIVIEQRGAQVESLTQNARPSRPRSYISTNIQAISAKIMSPKNTLSSEKKEIDVNIIRVSELGKREKKSKLEWLIVTNEPIDSLDNIDFIVRCYELRWKIEEFHKIWKTGCRAEERPFQTFAAVEKILVITSAIAIRLMQLHEAANAGIDVPATHLLRGVEWKVLWVAIEKCKPPRKAPSCLWAFGALARLGGWFNTKRTGRVGWCTIWRGWMKMQERSIALEGAIEFGLAM